MLQDIAWISIGIAAVCFLVISYDEFRHPQKMRIMNIVWPVTALYFSVIAVWPYFRIGRQMQASGSVEHRQTSVNGNSPGKKQTVQQKPSWRAVAISASHCGAGCVLADIVCEYIVFALALTLLGQSLYASYLLDLAVAWLFGIAFQYFMIKPMKQLSPAAALRAAVQADTLSILFFQLGMYAWMAIVYFLLWPNPHLKPNQPTFWFMMQIAMIFGFFTTCPINYWLVRSGLKESMV